MKLLNSKPELEMSNQSKIRFIIVLIGLLGSTAKLNAQWVGTSLEFTSPGTPYTRFQFAEHTWSGSHAILFNAYKSVSVSGSLLSTGNTKYANHAGSYGNGAGGVIFNANGGGMHFVISPISMGAGTDVNWGTPKITIARDGKVGVGTSAPTETLEVAGNGIISGKLSLAKDYNREISFAGDGHGGAHAILFNSYKGIESDWITNETLYSNGHGGYGGGAGSIMFYGNGGTMNFMISETSTGAGNLVDWGLPKMHINRIGEVGIGTTDVDGYRLSVAGNIRAEEIKVEASPWPDYVFEPDYNLPTLESLEKFIQSEKHLPEMPTAAEVEADGIALGQMNALLLKKIEELTLYTIEQEKEIENLRFRIEDSSSSKLTANSQELMAKQLNALLTRIEKLENR